MISRRDALRQAGAAALLSLLPLPASARPWRGRLATSGRLFFDPADVPRIRATAASPLLRPTVEAWTAQGTAPARAAIETVARTQEMITDFSAAQGRLVEQAVLHLLDPTAEREAVLLDGIDVILGLPFWDFFLEVDTPIGLQKAPEAVERLLFIREVLGDALGAEREARLLADIADKGCAPCALILAGMEDPTIVRGWRLDDTHAPYLDIDMSRWPVILGEINLRAVPLMGLGLGALALQGHDPRAEGWLDQAVRNARVVLGFFEPDGSYFEGIGYADYTLRSLFAFFDAHQRVDPSVRWAESANLEGYVRYVLAVQAGRTAEGAPDVVNFSDSWGSTAYCTPAWAARQLGGAAAGVAQFAVERVSRPAAFQDFLWVDPERPAVAPPEALKNARTDLDWIVARTGWDAGDAVLGFRSGRPANHEHADRNSLLFKTHGERLLTDHFGAAYDWRQPKWLLRQTEAHNAVLIDGRGHQYHNGEEGTNASRARAHVVRYEAAGDRVWWSSDATQAYALVHDGVRLVRRTVLFAKPDVVVVFDEVEAGRDVAVAARFFPDNRDGKAVLTADGQAFTLGRPGATLHGRTATRLGASVAAGRLDLAEDLGVYPYAEVSSPAARVHEIVTVFVARAAANRRVPAATAAPSAEGWTVAVGNVRARIGHIDGGMVGRVPDVTWL